MADLDHIITLRLITAIDEREWHERAVAKRLRCTEGMALYAPLFDRASDFWLELGTVVESGRTPDRDQAMAIAWLREPIEQKVMVEIKQGVFA